MLTRFSTLTLTAATLIAAASLAACGGGGGTPPSSPSTISPSTSTPTTPTPSPTPAVATASGTVVDFASNTGLAGETVAIASYSTMAAPVAVATTGPNGSFSFTAAPGSYLIEIGSNSATDTRATYHNEITLVAGPNALAQGVPSPEPNVTLSPAQQSGNFRLVSLSTNEQSCVSGINSGRTSAGLATLIPDENGSEYSEAMLAEEDAQNTDTPTLFNSRYFYGVVGYISAFTGGPGFSTCPDYTNTYTFTSTSVPYPTATNPKAIWYAADGGDGSTYTTQIFLEDPR